MGFPAKTITFSTMAGAAEFAPQTMGKMLRAAGGSFAHDLH